MMADGGKKMSAIYCSKCSLKFDGDSRTPRTLPCNHTLCQRCIQNILDQSEGHLKCPLCGRHHEVPCTKDAEAYPVNEDKLEIIRLLQEDEKQKKAEKSQDQENKKKDSQPRRKDENAGQKSADKEKGGAKDSVENEKTTKSSVKNEGTSGPTDNSKQPKDGDKNPDKAKSKCKKCSNCINFNREHNRE